MQQIYSFYCARYKDLRFKEFIDLGYEEFNIKIGSIPENEPLFKIIKSRAIKLSKIKDKDERKYWRELKKANRIPDEYLLIEEIDARIKEEVKNGGFKNAR